MTRRKEREERRRLARSSVPQIHVKVAHAEGDLGSAGALIKPALLYADRVTIYSPVAALVKSVDDFQHVTSPRQRASAALAMVEMVPAFAAQLNMDPESLDSVRLVIAGTSNRQGSRAMKRVARSATPADRLALEAFLGQVDELADQWAEGLPTAVANAIESAGGRELVAAVHMGAVEVADLSGRGVARTVADAVGAALGDAQHDSSTEVLRGFVSRVIEMLTEDGTFPLLDGSASDIVRELESEHLLEPSKASTRHGVEVSATAGLMGFLPNFVDLPLDEVVDLRRELATPLVTFRGAIAQLAADFQSRAFDDDFEVEVEDAWRTKVQPALAGIREALAEHGLLREIASVALGDPRRLFLEAGGVVAAAHADVLSISGLMAAGAATAIPAIDVTGRALERVLSNRRAVRRSAFYFLHRVGEVAADH